MSLANLASVCAGAMRAYDLSACKPLGLDASTWIAVLSALVALCFYAGRKLTKWRRSEKPDSYHIRRSLTQSRFRKLCAALKPLMNDNYRIFARFGPNSGRGDGLPKTVRYELGIWYQSRKKIVENNAKIGSLITSNLSAIPSEFQYSFSQWLDHIDAFSAHVEDPSADYREHQFPKEVSSIVSRYA